MAKKDEAVKPARGSSGSAAKKAPAKKTAAKKTAAKTTTGAPRGRAGGAGDLRSELRLFATARPEGWGHHDWLSFLEHLEAQGHDTGDSDGIGRQLERERLAVTLERVRGLGPRRVDALVERFETLWSVRQADVDEIAAVSGMNRPLAERVRQELQQ